MRHRAALLAVVAAVLAVPAAGLAQTPCDVLPPTVTQSLCQPCTNPPSPPVPPGRDPVLHKGFDYTDGSHSQCKCFGCGLGKEMGKDTCTANTNCLPGWERFQDGGVWKCRQPATDQMKDNCYRGLPLSIAAVKTDQDLPLNTLYPGLTHLFVHGQGAANGTSGAMTGNIHVEVGEAIRRAGSNAYCLPPDCQVVELNVPSSAAGSQQTLTLYTPKRYRSASRTITVSVRPTPTPVMSQAGLGHATTIGSSGAGPRPPQFQRADAGMSCPGPNFQKVSSPVVEVRSAQVQATATATYLHTTVPPGVPACTWDDAFQFKIHGLDGQGDVTVSWIAAHAANYANPVNLSTSQTITLTKGRWQIVPGATFPPDFTYSVSFTD